MAKYPVDERSAKEKNAENSPFNPDGTIKHEVIENYRKLALEVVEQFIKELS